MHTSHRSTTYSRAVEAPGCLVLLYLTRIMVKATDRSNSLLAAASAKPGSFPISRCISSRTEIWNLSICLLALHRLAAWEATLGTHPLSTIGVSGQPLSKVNERILGPVSRWMPIIIRPLLSNYGDCMLVVPVHCSSERARAQSHLPTPWIGSSS